MRSVYDQGRAYVQKYKRAYDLLNTAVQALMAVILVMFVDSLEIVEDAMLKIAPSSWAGMAVCALAAALLWAKSRGIHELIDMKTICAVDRAVMTGMLSALFALAGYMLFLPKYAYKLVILGVAVGASAWLFTRRARAVSDTGRKSSCQVFELEQLYRGDIGRLGAGQPILFSEKAVSRDLLGRKSIIDQLEKSIRTGVAEHSFVIGLEGAWGSGKTTILNIVKENIRKDERFIVIDEMDPWVFEDREKLMLSMMDAIIKNTGGRYSFASSRKALQSVVSMVSGHELVKGVLQGFSVLADEGDLSRMKEQLSEYLEKNSQAVAFFIDNIDRATADNIIFLFKLIGTVFDIPRIIYILSYDKQRINSAFQDTLKIDSRYMEKIVQTEIHVPQVQRERLRAVLETCIVNLIRAYQGEAFKESEFHALIGYLSDEIQDLRQFKRLLNSVFVSVFCSGTVLDLFDLLAIETIRFIDPELYNWISENRWKLVSYHSMNSEYVFLKWMMIGGKYEEHMKDFLSSVSHSPYQKKLLSTIFPVYKRHGEGDSLAGNRDREKSIEVVRRCRICSERYMDLYFSFDSNVHSHIAEYTRALIGKINHSQDGQEVKLMIWQSIAETTGQHQHEYFEMFSRHIEGLKEKWRGIAASAYFESIARISDSRMFGVLDAKERAIVLVHDLLYHCSEEDFYVFLNTVKGLYGGLQGLDGILYWFDRDEKRGEGKPERRQAVYEALKDACTEIIEKGVDLYSDPHYSAKNIWALQKLLDVEGKRDVFRSYMDRIMKPELVYRVIGDAVSEAMGTGGYSYQIDKERLNLLGVENYAFDAFFEQNPPKTPSEELMKELYEDMRAGRDRQYFPVEPEIVL